MKNIIIILTGMVILSVLSCKKETVYPSIEDSTWDVYVLWSSSPDTILFHTKFNAGGNGEEVDNLGNPLPPNFTWTQDKSAISWSYNTFDIVFTGSTTTEGTTMTGTSVSGALTGGWRAVKQ